MESVPPHARYSASDIERTRSASRLAPTRPICHQRSILAGEAGQLPRCQFQSGSDRADRAAARHPPRWRHRGAPGASGSTGRAARARQGGDPSTTTGWVDHRDAARWWMAAAAHQLRRALCRMVRRRTISVWPQKRPNQRPSLPLSRFNTNASRRYFGGWQQSVFGRRCVGEYGAAVFPR